MITINNKSRYFSASEDMFPTMERNFAWLFGMQTPEQGWKTVLALTIMYRAQGSAEDVVDVFGREPGATLQGLARDNANLLGETYHTQGALRFGDYMGKISLAPASKNVRALTGKII